jgi:hypothetical protein
MSDTEDTFTGGGKSDSFVSYLTTITPVEKNELLNVFQYTLLAIIPLVLFLKFMKEYIPPENPTKSTIEITTEVVIQLFLIFVVFWIIHKVILYIPTYSNTPYEKLNMVQLVLPVLFLLFCMKSSISEKLSILLERAMILVGLKTEGMEDDPKNKSKKEGMQPSQGQSMPQMMPMNMPQMMPMNTSNQQESRDIPMNTMNNPNFGIQQEPFAANEMGGCYGSY